MTECPACKAEAVMWNAFNAMTQCHACGQVVDNQLVEIIGKALHKSSWCRCPDPEGPVFCLEAGIPVVQALRQTAPEIVSKGLGWKTSDEGIDEFSKG